VPPFDMVNVPVPLPPTITSKLLVQVDPAPSTVTVPAEPASNPI
jgi:hypothetical protein